LLLLDPLKGALAGNRYVGSVAVLSLIFTPFSLMNLSEFRRIANSHLGCIRS